MNARHALVCLVFALAAVGCAKENSLAPERTSTQPPSASETFVLTSEADPRLPAPGGESAGATSEDLDWFASLGRVRPTTRTATTPHPVTSWNRLTTELGIAAKLPPTLISRAYALVQVGIYDALVVGSHPGRGSLPPHSVATGAATNVLAYLFPQDIERIREVAAEQLAHDRGRPLLSLSGWAIGRAVGRLVVLRGKMDGSDTPFTGPIPTGDGIWTGTNPVTPMCGTWKTWLLPSGSAIEPRQPYPFGSPEDLAGVQEVLDVSLNLTPEQIAIAQKWAALPPPTIWNGFLNDRIEAQSLGALRAARAHAYLNATMADAFICCWATKYAYWTARPFQRIPNFTPVITTPNFPSYTSGHSTISAAAAQVMAALFPSERDHFEAQAAEAAMSRLFGGIHFRKDNEQGAAVGGKIGDLAARRMRSHDILRIAAAD